MRIYYKSLFTESVIIFGSLHGKRRGFYMNMYEGCHNKRGAEKTSEKAITECKSC